MFRSTLRIKTPEQVNFNGDMANSKEVLYIFLCQIKHPCKQLAFEIIEAFVTALKILFICKIFKRRPIYDFSLVKL